MKIVFLDAATMGDADMSCIAALGEFVCYPSSTPEQARERASDADVVILNKILVNKEFLDAAPKLRLVCEAGTGINNIDVDLCKERGVIVRNVAGYSTDSVAQIAWMHILNLAGRAFHYNAYVRDGRYSAGSIHVDADKPFTELTGKTLGIVGLGAIGSRVADIGKAFGMKVIYYSTTGKPHNTPYAEVPLDVLLRCSDVVSIHCPYNSATAGLIGYKELCTMKPSAILVNVSRGGIVVEADLARAIDERRIWGAAIDVYEREPIAKDHPYLRMHRPKRLLLSPHIAWYSRESRARLAEAMAENIKLGW